MTVSEFWDYCHRPENERRSLDLSRGRAVEWPPRDRRQGFVAARAGHLLAEFSATAGVGVPSLACGVILDTSDGTVRGVSAALFPSGPAADGWAVEPPVVAVFVRGPADNPAEVAAWAADFITNGTDVMWVIDTTERAVEVFRPGGPPVTLRGSDRLTGGGIAAAFTCQAGDLFRLPGERLT